MVKRVLVEVLGLAESDVEVIAPDVGGGFGIKIAVAREEIAVCLIALQTGRPARWIENTIEHLTNAPHGRDEVNDVAVAYSGAGQVLGMHVDSLSDTGAYSVSPLSSAIEAAAVPVRLPSIYELGDYSYRSRAVATNKPPLGTYRGVAAPVGVFIMERLLQDIAADTGLDFAEVQRANFLPEDVPARNAAGVTYDPGRYREAFALMLDRLGYAERRAEQDRLRQRGARELIGIGMGALVEPSAVSMDGLGLRVVTDWEDAFARLNPDGTAEVRISAASSGQAHETTFAQIAAEALHIGRDQVRVRSNGSDEGMYGSGSWGSRVTVVAGGAVSLAAQEIAAKLCAIAAHQFGVSPDEVSLTEGGAAAGDHFASLADLCTIAYFRMSELPDGMAPGLAAFSTYRPARGFTSPYGFHGCVLAVDTLTGELRIDKYVVVSDVGRVVTPALLAEQIRGGLAQGLGEALFEEIRYGADGLQRTRSLFDYRMPRALDVPEVEIHHLQTPATGNILGVRGASEARHHRRTRRHRHSADRRADARRLQGQRIARPLRRHHPRGRAVARRLRRGPGRTSRPGPGGHHGGGPVKLPPLDYIRPGTVTEALEVWSDREVMFLAGGQGLLSEMGQGLRRHATLADISAIPELGTIEITADGSVLQAGAAVRLRQLAGHPALRGSLLAAAARHVGVPPIRVLATVGGNFCHGHPTAELPLAALVAGASLAGFRRDGTEVRFTGPELAALRPAGDRSEVLLTALEWPITATVTSQGSPSSGNSAPGFPPPPWPGWPIDGPRQRSPPRRPVSGWRCATAAGSCSAGRREPLHGCVGRAGRRRRRCRDRPAGQRLADLINELLGEDAEPERM